MRAGVVGHCIYIDECGYNIWTRRTYERAPRGEPVRRVVNNQQGRNCNITFAISNEIGLIHHSVRLATTTLESFQQFIQDTCDAAVQILPADKPIHLIYDNARPHINAHRRTPPYSPFLNPVEMAHSAFKAAVKHTLSLPQWQARVGDVAAAREAGVNLQAWPARCLQEAAEENIDVQPC